MKLHCQDPFVVLSLHSKVTLGKSHKTSPNKLLFGLALKDVMAACPLTRSTSAGTIGVTQLCSMCLSFSSKLHTVSLRLQQKNRE